MGAILLVALVIGADRGSGPPTDSERVFALSRSIACPTCDGQSVSESEAPLAREIRRDIARRVDAGETDDQILSYYADTQGTEILLTPPSEGIGGLVWVIPVAGALVALAALAFVFLRWKQRPKVHASDADRDLVARALGGDQP
jgi:cytochrome c-type biogenesis protein CcmH